MTMADKALVAQMLQLVPEQGIHPSAAPGVALVRSNGITALQPIVYQPVFYLVVQGQKRSYLGAEVYQYDPLHFLALSVPLPMAGHVTRASSDEPYLALKIAIEPKMVLDAMDEQMLLPPLASPRGVCVCPLTAEMNEVVGRLLAALADEAKARVLVPLMVRELLFHALRGPQGAQLAAFVTQGRHHQRIARVIEHIQDHFNQPLAIDSLAGVASMSPSSLHHHFKAVTNASPLQYIKTLRLHQARELVTLAGTSVSEAAFQVGYQSLSQFSREYKRLFGQPPSESRPSV
ncbi:MAG: AraC family transcriptional regulator [Gammaproteobacteria bacterium]|nr:AraC family transcriptional regulator [Gammaproteobacteria bacterium]